MKVLPRRLYEECELRFPPFEATLHLSHPHIVAIMEVVEEPDRILLVQEYLGGGDLFSCMQDAGVFSEFLARCCFSDLAEGTTFLHSHGIVHRDLKPENCVLDSEGNVKIIDFGFAASFVPGQLFTEYVGSLEYCSPEVIREVPYEGPPVDVWALGVILFDMVMGDLPFQKSEQTYDFPLRLVEGSVSRELLRLLQSLLCEKSSLRMPSDAILKSSWILLGVRVCPSQRLELKSSSSLSLSAAPPALLSSTSSPSSDSSVMDLTSLPLDSPLHRRLIFEHRRALRADMGFGRDDVKIGRWHKIKM